jgi:VanZ family protein
MLPISYLAHTARPSWLGRHFLAAWHALIVMASLYPFTGWRHTGEPVFAFLTYPLPYFQTGFDNWLNMLAYLPLGYAWAMTCRCRWYAPLVAVVAGAMLSGSMEFVQQFLPSRVASNLDLLYNTAGALAGALLAGASQKLLWVRAWHVRRARWFRAGALVDYALVLMLLWLITQMNPAVPWLGVVVQPQGLPQPWISPIANAALFLRALEAAGVMLHATAVGLMVSTLLAHRWMAPRWIAGWIALSLAVKMVFAGVLLQPGAFLAWFNLNVLAGATAAAGLLILLLRLKRRWQALAALVCLIASEGVELYWPLSGGPGSPLALFRQDFGHLVDFNGLSQTLSTLWPWLAAAYLAPQAWSDWRRSHQPTVIG